VSIPPYGVPADVPPWGVEPPAPARRSRRGVVVGATVAGVLVLGGAGFAVAAYLDGGGTQPEDVFPADTFAFARLDLDPSLDQKMAMMALLEKFPGLDVEGDGDVRAQIMGPLLELSENNLDYAADVEPWLGDRMGAAVVSAEDADGGVAPVIALAVDDEALMEETLTRVQAGTEFGYAVRDGYVLITDNQERAEDLAAADETLADDADFAGDREALGGDQVALAWADLGTLQGLMLAQAEAAGVPAEEYQEQPLSGRVIVGAHAEDEALELVALDFSVSDVGVPDAEPTRLVEGLPEDTLAALSASGIGDRAVAYWDSLEQTGVVPPGEEPFPGVDLDLPEDLRAILGTDLVVAAFGDVEFPAVGVRVVTEDGRRAAVLVNELLTLPEFGLETVPAGVDDGYAFGTDQAAAQAVSADDGGLWNSERFRDAVADPDAASVIGYVDLAAVVEQAAALGGQDGVDAADFAALDALGFSVTSTDEGSRIVVRITTR
jgi:hypothetical protein